MITIETRNGVKTFGSVVIAARWLSKVNASGLSGHRFKQGQIESALRNAGEAVPVIFQTRLGQVTALRNWLEKL